MYHAKIHPEQHSNTLSDEQIKELTSSIHYVCDTSVKLLADAEKFPENWIFKHRWGKGKKNHPSVLPNGDKITYIKVGGRTSAVVESVQKKLGAVKHEAGKGAASKRKRAEKTSDSDAEKEEEEEEEGKPRAKKAAPKGRSAAESAGTSKTTSAGGRRSTRSKK